jgi:hypothetical protein
MVELLRCQLAIAEQFGAGARRPARRGMRQESRFECRKRFQRQAQARRHRMAAEALDQPGMRAATSASASRTWKPGIERAEPRSGRRPVRPARTRPPVDAAGP